MHPEPLKETEMQPESTTDAPRQRRVRRARSAERAFEAFYSGHYRQVVAYCVADLHDWAEAEEVAADAFMVLWRAWPRLRAHDDRTLKAYVFAVARRRLLRVAPARRRRPPTFPFGWGDDDGMEHDPALIDPASRDMSPDAVTDRLTRRVAVALRALDDDERAVVLLRCADGRSLSEVAREVGTTDGAANVLLRRGLHHLWERLLGALPR